MKVVAINGSPNREGNTYNSLKVMEKLFLDKGIEFEIMHVGNRLIRGCMACGRCVKNRDEKCGITDDIVNESIQKLKNADGIILGSPVHYAAISGTMKSFLDRVFYVASVNRGLFKRKVGAAVVAVRRSGGLPAFDQLNNFMNYSEMVLVSSNYWNVIHGMWAPEVLQDEEGVQILEVLASNFIWLLESLEISRDQINRPENVRKKLTNFIR